MKRLFITTALVLAAGFVFAAQYENPMLNMSVPSGLEQGQMYFYFEHKFYQTLHNYPNNDLFAVFDNSANMNIGLRYMAFAGLEVSAGYTVQNREKLAGASYALKFPGLYFNLQAGIQLFSYHDYIHDNEDTNLFYSLALQSIPLFDDKFLLSLDAAYDGYNENPGFGIGASYEVFRGLSVLAEYYPAVKADPNNTLIGSTGCYSFGFKIQTSGHQFIFKFGNSYDVGMRRLMLGTKTQDVYAGFEIMRLINF
jgi:hypothetical protein